MARFYFCPTDGSYEIGRSIYAQYRAPIPQMCRKYHVSTSLHCAFDVADCALPILREAGVLHKVVATPLQLAAQFQGDQAGKFITIYMAPDVSQRNPLIDRLGAALAGLDAEPSPTLPRSRRYSHVFAEMPLDEAMFIYGGFVVDPRV